VLITFFNAAEIIGIILKEVEIGYVTQMSQNYLQFLMASKLFPKMSFEL